MTNPTPEAIEAVMEAMSARLHVTSDTWSPQFRPAMSADTTSVQIGAEAALAFIRDAIHRDGPDADAIRETLGLRRAVIPLVKGGTHTVVMGEWQDVKAQAKSAGQRCSACGTSEDDCWNAATACCGLCLIRAGFTHGGSGS